MPQEVANTPFGRPTDSHVARGLGRVSSAGDRQRESVLVDPDCNSDRTAEEPAVAAMSVALRPVLSGARVPELEPWKQQT